MATVGVVRTPQLTLTVVEPRDTLLALACLRDFVDRRKQQEKQKKEERVAFQSLSTKDSVIFTVARTTLDDVQNAWDVAGVRHSTVRLSRGDVFFMPAGVFMFALPLFLCLHVLQFCLGVSLSLVLFSLFLLSLFFSLLLSSSLFSLLLSLFSLHPSSSSSLSLSSSLSGTLHQYSSTACAPVFSPNPTSTTVVGLTSPIITWSHVPRTIATRREPFVWILLQSLLGEVVLNDSSSKSLLSSSSSSSDDDQTTSVPNLVLYQAPEMMTMRHT